MSSLDTLTDSETKLIENFQCPGCVRGSDITCGAFKLWKESGVSCRGHIPGTALSGVGYILLGMPKGFNRLGDWYNYNDPNLMFKQIGIIGLVDKMNEEAGKEKTKGLAPSGGYDMTTVHIRLYPKDAPRPTWNKFNIAVWAMVHEGHLFVRTYSPRINRTYIDVIEGGTMDMVPGAIDVGEFKDDID